MAHCGCYNIPPTLHKIFEHRADVIRLFPPSITSGMLTEEPLESTSKDVKNFQLDHSRQTSLVDRNWDTFHRLLDRSDPKILRHVTDKKLAQNSREPIPKAVLDLCVESEALISMEID